MKRIVCLTLIALLALSTNAQRRRRVRKKAPTPEELAEQARQEKLKLARLATAQVVFVDSVVVPREQLFAYMNESNGETGEVTEEGFTSQLGNKRLLSKKGNDGMTRLYESDLIGQEWTQETPLKGLPENDSVQQYPFMLADGVTLYYAAKNENGLGGLDIYMTRYDADEAHFLTPENIGMPFNSEANDYLYIIDDFNNLGTFVTDRGQDSGMVCIYTFIPPVTRSAYNVEELGEERLKALADINSIRDTWTDRNAVNDALKRIGELRQEERHTYKKDFEFVVNDRLTYTSLSYFKDSRTRSMAETWLKNKGIVEEKQRELATLREQYAAAPTAQKNAMATKILAMEADVELAAEQLHKQEKDIREALLNR